MSWVYHAVLRQAFFFSLWGTYVRNYASRWRSGRLLSCYFMKIACELIGVLSSITVLQRDAIHVDNMQNVKQQHNLHNCQYNMVPGVIWCEQHAAQIVFVDKRSRAKYGTCVGLGFEHGHVAAIFRGSFNLGFGCGYIAKILLKLNKCVSGTLNREISYFSLFAINDVGK